MATSLIDYEPSSPAVVNDSAAVATFSFALYSNNIINNSSIGNATAYFNYPWHVPGLAESDYGYYDYDEDGNPTAYFIPDNPFLVPAYGYIANILILITLITNCAVCAVLLRSHMRNPTNALLVAIATSDMLTGVCPLPCYVYFFLLGRYREWVPYSWCFAHASLIDFVPTVFHTASIWLTVTLAVQRYIYVCHALTARQLCTVPIFVRVIVIIFVVALLSHVCRFADTYYVPVEIESKITPNETVTGCILDLKPFIKEHANIYFNVYFWFRVVFIHLVPCSALVVLTALLINAMRRAQHRRRQLLKQNRRSESRRLAESNWTTLMLVAVVVVFLVVEFPLAILFILLIVRNTFEIDVADAYSFEVATLFVNTAILLSYPFNFVIYCGMSKQFRSTFRGMFCGGAAGAGSGSGGYGTAAEHTNYASVANNGRGPAAAAGCRTVETRL